MDTTQTPATLDDVRLAIFRQHTQLAQLLDELETHAQALIASGGERKAMDEALERLQTRFVRHLEYEEKHLENLLPKPSTPGEGLLGDHDDQRRRIKGLVHDREVFHDPRTLAHEALAFVHHLRKDMEEEDKNLRALR